MHKADACASALYPILEAVNAVLAVLASIVACAAFDAYCPAEALCSLFDSPSACQDVLCFFRLRHGNFQFAYSLVSAFVILAQPFFAHSQFLPKFLENYYFAPSYCDLFYYYIIFLLILQYN